MSGALAGRFVAVVGTADAQDAVATILELLT
jgi:hypothetical protein